MNTNKLMPIRSNTVNSGKQVRQQSSALDKLDLNSPDFDAEQYVRNLLREKGIDDLVAVEEDMVKSVRWLDSEMRELVYENYNKFLMATQAVRNMQGRLQELSDSVGSVSKRMETIVANSDELTKKFAANSDRIRRLVEAKRLIDAEEEQ